jgi:hypothetical protein
MRYSKTQLGNTDGVASFGRYKTPIDKALALVPRTDETLMDNTAIFFLHASTELLHVLLTYPVRRTLPCRPTMSTDAFGYWLQQGIEMILLRPKY